MSVTDGHAFISYVREDREKVDRVQSLLVGAGVRVWRDTADLWPGDDWRLRIRQAITDDALAFIACFSQASNARAVNGQNEELVLAVEQLRRRLPGNPWLIPVRLDPCEIPDLEIGGGRTLRSLERVDLFDDTWHAGAGRLVVGVSRILQHEPTPASQLVVDDDYAALKRALRDDGGDIEVYDRLTSCAEAVAASLSDSSRYPTSGSSLHGSETSASLKVAATVQQYMDDLAPVLPLIAMTCSWGRTANERALTHAAEEVAGARGEQTGEVVLLDLQWFPTLPVLYAGGVASVRQRNYGALRALAVDAHVDDLRYGRVPLVARSYAWRPFSNFVLTPHVLAARAAGVETTEEYVRNLINGRVGKKFKPLSSFFHDALREPLRPLIRNDRDYDVAFDEFEVLLALLSLDAAAHAPAGVYCDPPYLGSFAVTRFAAEGTPVRLRREFEDALEGWPPLTGRLFGGAVERARAAFLKLEETIAEEKPRG